MATKRQKRAVKSLKKARKQRQKFPELLLKVIENSGIVLQVLDFRFIENTRNKEIEELIKKKEIPLIYVLNKSDLVKKKEMDEFLKMELAPYVLVSATKRKGGKDLRNKIKQLSNSAKQNEDGKISVGVIGYPNVGKSSVINLLIGKKSAKTAASAGFTKGLQKLKLTKDIVLIDSPGVIPAKEYSAIDFGKIAMHTMVGSRDYSKVKDPEMVVTYLFNKNFKAFQVYYKIATENSEELIEFVGKKRNILKKGGEVDADKTSRQILKDWQEGEINL